MTRGDTSKGMLRVAARDGSDEGNNAERDKENNSYCDVVIQPITCLSIWILNYRYYETFEEKLM